jgi:tetratricopeptide (TPR) repeat protein
MNVPRSSAVPSFSWRLIVLATVLIVLLPGPAAADPWYEHYINAEDALNDQDWPRAVAEINEALARKGDSGARVRSYGMNVVAYFPYFKLGVAYYHLGQYDAALQAFETEARLGAIPQSQTDNAELERYRLLVEEARTTAAAEETHRIRQTVEQSLGEARDLEQQGQLDGAMAALDRALAVAPDDADANAAMTRLRQKYADQERDRERELRVTWLIEEGRTLFEGGQYNDAASLFREALILRPGTEIQALLDASEDMLRGDSDAPVIDEQARAQKNRLAQERSEREAQKARRANIARLLDEAATRFDDGAMEDALSAANRVLALDPGNADALAYVAQAYGVISRQLLGSVTGSNIPPAIRFVDLRQEEKDGLPVQTIDMSDFRLNGVIIDDSPVSVTFFDRNDQEIEGSLDVQPIGDFYLTEFNVAASLPPGGSTFRLVATDPEGLASSSEYEVFYARSFHRSPWFYEVLIGVILGLGAALLWQRRRQGELLRQRRFNPYVAGAPVLEDDMFFGRQELVDRILQTIHNNSLLIYGERRIGKTSIQHQLKKRLRALDDPVYEFHPVYVDLQGTPETRFFQTIAEDIFLELGSRLGDLRSVREETREYSYRDFVADVRAVLNTLQGQTDKKVRLVLLIDEVDELNDYDPRINQKLRSLFMKSFAENLAAVVSGVEIKKKWEKEGSPWYNFFEEIQVEPLDMQDARDLIERPIRGMFKLENGTTEKIIAMTGGKPYLIQRLCIALITRLHVQQRRRITIADVEAVGRSGST